MAPAPGTPSTTGWLTQQGDALGAHWPKTPQAPCVVKNTFLHVIAEGSAGLSGLARRPLSAPASAGGGHATHLPREVLGSVGFLTQPPAEEAVPEVVHIQRPVTHWIRAQTEPVVPDPKVEPQWWEMVDTLDFSDDDELFECGGLYSSDTSSDGNLDSSSGSSNRGSNCNKGSHATIRQTPPHRRQHCESGGPSMYQDQSGGSALVQGHPQHLEQADHQVAHGACSGMGIARSRWMPEPHAFFMPSMTDSGQDASSHIYVGSYDSPMVFSTTGMSPSGVAAPTSGIWGVGSGTQPGDSRHGASPQDGHLGVGPVAGNPRRSCGLPPPQASTHGLQTLSDRDGYVGAQGTCASEADSPEDDTALMLQQVSQHAGDCLDPVPWGPDTVTVMVRQIPRVYTQRMLVQEVSNRGFKGLFDFLYLPYDLRKGINVGYGFLNFTEPRHAQAFRKALDGAYLDRHMRIRGKPIRVHPATTQGYEANFQHFAGTKTWQKQDPCFRPIFLRGPGALPARLVAGAGALDLAVEPGPPGAPPQMLPRMPLQPQEALQRPQQQDAQQQQFSTLVHPSHNTKGSVGAGPPGHALCWRVQPEHRTGTAFEAISDSAGNASMRTHWGQDTAPSKPMEPGHWSMEACAGWTANPVVGNHCEAAPFPTLPQQQRQEQSHSALPRESAQELRAEPSRGVRNQPQREVLGNGREQRSHVEATPPQEFDNSCFACGEPRWCGLFFCSRCGAPCHDGPFEAEDFTSSSRTSNSSVQSSSRPVPARSNTGRPTHQKHRRR